ncbi:Methyltransferase-related protein [Parasponia andersonii]|uniref:Methyltransferase-related protein n=1 Tax=Parasponia andersonii TaxID=3476 RepID=A0A2P5ALZ8_PARAD|nr:Methyltransferase-related protein [Parasponia andersonii]
MCPLRFILVFFSAVLAGYFAWKTVGSSRGADLDYDDSIKEKISPKEEETGFKRIVQHSFWVFVDMASGRYLWRNLGDMKNKGEKVKSGSKL